MGMRTARGMRLVYYYCGLPTDSLFSIIQDCEDALTNWVESRAQIRSRLSQRGARTRRTGGRASRVRHNLADQDRPLQDQRGSWVPADEHERKTTRNTVALNHNDDDEYEDISDDEASGRSQHQNQQVRDGNSDNSRRTLEDDRSGSQPAGTRGRREAETLANED